jgi:hypothetical protein
MWQVEHSKTRRTRKKALGALLHACNARMPDRAAAAVAATVSPTMSGVVCTRLALQLSSPRGAWSRVPRARHNLHRRNRCRTVWQERPVLQTDIWTARAEHQVTLPRKARTRTRARTMPTRQGCVCSCYRLSE